MKTIFITGMNKNQCTRDYFKRQQLKVVPCQYALTRALEDMGWAVTQELFSLYNFVIHSETIVFLAKPQQLVASSVYQGLEAIATNPDCIIGFDDWQIDDILQSLEKCKNPKNLYTDFILKNHGMTRAEITPEREMLHQRAIDIILAKKNRVLLPAFAGGDLGKIIDWPKELLFSFNPNPYHLNRTPDFGIDGAPEKQRSYNFASLVQSKTKKWIKNQKLTWPVHYYGSKADGQDRLTEDQMVNVFYKDWGCLMPGYYHAGSGWWRARPLQVAQAGSILIGDADEMRVLYKNEDILEYVCNADEMRVLYKNEDILEYVCNASKVEQLDDAGLVELAALQKNMLLNAHPLDKSVTREELMKCLV